MKLEAVLLQGDLKMEYPPPCHNLHCGNDPNIDTLYDGPIDRTNISLHWWGWVIFFILTTIIGLGLLLIALLIWLIIIN